MLPCVLTTPNILSLLLVCCTCNCFACNATTQTKQTPSTSQAAKQTTASARIIYNNKYKVIHVFVALCDNLHQGIEPVPKGIGNGQDPATNLYWGCDYGVKAFFKNLTSWKLISTTQNPAPHILERCIFKEPTFNAYIVADAYDGVYIKQTMADFLNAAAGVSANTVVFQNDTLGIAGNAGMVAYIGHEGLMDFSLDSFPSQHDSRKRDAVILACDSKQYWNMILRKAGANPLLWTTDLMCPEAYTLHAAIAGWLNKEAPMQIQQRAAEAYSKYQHCTLSAARCLLVTGY